MSSKIKKTIMWVLIGLLTLQFAAAGLSKFTGSWDARFIDWGYRASFVYLIGVIEVAGIIGLYVPKIRKWSVLILAMTMLGAAFTHLFNDEAGRLIHNLIIIIALLVVFLLSKKLKTM
jgi:uncharacterized membrane protein YphA (DoxX/SURF4 family)